MKLLRYGKLGHEKPAMLDAHGNIYDLSLHIKDINGAMLSDENLAKISALDINNLPVVDTSLDENKRIGACVADIGKFIGIGLNYSDHAAETNAKVPEEPIIFMKALSAICGPNDDVYIPRDCKNNGWSQKTDWEVELGIIIGKKAKYVKEDEAEQYIAGYCVVNDVSERAFQTERSGQWTKGKSCDNFGPIGPYLVTRDEVQDPHNLKMWLSVNGQMMQNGSTQTMVFKPYFLVSYLSHYMTLNPGDLITTGTPPGVAMGMKIPQYLKNGDIVELGIEGLGQQKQKFIHDPD